MLLQARGIRKAFGATIALNGVDFDIQAGAVNVLIGENGAGKSTLMKIIAGVERPTSGTLLMDGKPISLGSTKDAASHGISIVHQELSLCPNLSVAENIFLGRNKIIGATFIDSVEEARQARSLTERFGQAIPADALVETLRIGQQQIVEIARALANSTRILILDEPTSALSPLEIDVLFEVIRDLRARGIAIVYISHKLEELLRIGDFITVLRDGNLQASAPAKDVSLDWIISQMLGKATSRSSTTPRPTSSEAAIHVEGLSIARPAGGTLLSEISLIVPKGQVLAIYGLLGCGRTEFFETVLGLRPHAAGRISLFSEDISKLSLRRRVRKGIHLVPEDRQRDGLFPNLSVGGNLGIGSLHAFAPAGLILRTKENTSVLGMIERMGVKTYAASASILSLSGGNQQKVVIGRCVMPGPKLLLIDEPGRGVDIGAREEIFRQIQLLAAEGMTVLFSTSDLGEALTGADRILVFAGGRITADLKADEATEQTLVEACNVTTPVAGATIPSPTVPA